MNQVIVFLVLSKSLWDGVFVTCGMWSVRNIPLFSCLANKGCSWTLFEVSRVLTTVVNFFLQMSTTVPQYNSLTTASRGTFKSCMNLISQIKNKNVYNTYSKVTPRTYVNMSNLKKPNLREVSEHSFCRNNFVWLSYYFCISFFHHFIPRPLLLWET